MSTLELNGGFALQSLTWFFWVPALQDLMKLRRKESQLNQVTAEAQGATTRLKYSGVELEVLRKKNIVRCQTVGVACRLRQRPIESPEEAEIDELVAPVSAGYFSHGEGPGQPGVADPAAAAERGDQGGLHGEDQRPDLPGCVSPQFFFKSFCKGPLAVDLLTAAQVLADERRRVFRLLRGDRRGQHQGVRAGTPEAADRAGEETVGRKRETEAFKRIQQGF